MVGLLMLFVDIGHAWSSMLVASSLVLRYIRLPELSGPPPAGRALGSGQNDANKHGVPHHHGSNSK